MLYACCRNSWNLLQEIKDRNDCGRLFLCSRRTVRDSKCRLIFRFEDMVCSEFYLCGSIHNYRNPAKRKKIAMIFKNLMNAFWFEKAFITKKGWV